MPLLVLSTGSIRTRPGAPPLGIPLKDSVLKNPLNATARSDVAGMCRIIIIVSGDGRCLLWGEKIPRPIRPRNDRSF